MALVIEVGRNKWRIRAILIGITAFLWLGIALHFVPLWWAVTTSFKPMWEIYAFPPSLLPKEPTLIAWKVLGGGLSDITGTGIRPLTVLAGQSIWLYIKNSFIITGGIVIFQVAVASLVGYSLSKLCSPKWSRVMFIFFIGTMLAPSGVSLIPKYLLLRFFPFAARYAPYIPFTTTRFPSINLTGTYWGVILPFVYSGFSVLLFKGFFDGIPDELINAARLDGSSEIGIFRRIILPLSRPVFAVVAYFTFSAAWNEFLWPLIILRGSNKLKPLSLALYEFQQTILSITPENPGQEAILRAGLGMNAMMAFAIVQSIPVFIMFIIFREQLMKGIKLRGFK